MPSLLIYAVLAALVFGICALVDRLFTKLFRSKAQHRSGLAIRVNKRYGLFGVILIVLGILGLIAGANGEAILTYSGIGVALMGAALAVHYLSTGIFYDADTFLVCRFARKDQEHRYQDITGQRLYAITGGNLVIELQLENGGAVSIQTSMDGAYPFLDAAFAAWCRQTGRDPDSCTFHDPSKSWWFPHEEEA